MDQRHLVNHRINAQINNGIGISDQQSPATDHLLITVFLIAFPFVANFFYCHS